MSDGHQSILQKAREGLHSLLYGDLKKIFPMMGMLFFICFNYSLLRNMKDTLLVKAPGSGPAVIPFVKVWCMLPMAIILTIIFTKLSNRFSQEKVFYIIISGFLAFYSLFAFVLFPYRDFIHPHGFADMVQTYLPQGAKWGIALFRNWSITLFYVMSELWSSIVLTVLFWGFLNEVTKVSEAKKFYGLYSVGSNLSAIVAGIVGVYLSDWAFQSWIPFGRSGWEQSVMIQVMVVVIFGILTMGIFRWMNVTIFRDSTYRDMHDRVHTEEPKKKMRLSFRESFRYLSKSKYLMCLAVIVLAYNLVINLVEVVWKDQVNQMLISDVEGSQFNVFLSYVTMSIGIVSTIAAIMMPWIINRMGWAGTAIITPVIMLVTSLGFFAFYLFQDSLGQWVMGLIGFSPIAIAVFFGAMQNSLSKAAKYSVFDTTKEMAFIPLSHEVKLKGKAAIDGVGSRVGKSGGSIIHQGLLLLFGSLSVSAPYVAAILMGMIFLWILSVRVLGREFSELTQQQQEERERASNLDPVPAVQTIATRS